MSAAIGSPGARMRSSADRRATRLLGCGVALFLAGLFGSADVFAETAILPLSEVRAGMRGIGHTVFSGDRIEEFGVEVLSVMRRTRPQGDLILFRGEGETLEHTGIIAGMSGSPVYIDGKLVGAVSFAYNGAIDPIGAITPIEEMLALLRPDLSAPVEESTGDAGPLETHPRARALLPFEEGASGGRRFQSIWNAFLAGSSARAERHGTLRQDAVSLLAPYRDQLSGGRSARRSGELAPVAIPLGLSGWAEPLQAEMEATLETAGFSCISAPAGGDEAGRASAALVPGAAVGVLMVRGDANLAAIGTVTYVDEQNVLAFGHPMIQGGRVAFPMTTAWIHGVIATNAVSIKMGAPITTVGGIFDDRRPGIAGVIGGSADLLPIRVTMAEEGKDARQFRYEVVRHPFLTPFFLPWSVSNSYLAAGWSMGDASLRTVTTVHFDGGRTVTRRDRISTDAPAGALGADMTVPAVLLLENPFERVRVDSVAVEVQYERRNSAATLRELRCTPLRAEVGDTLQLSATFEPFRGATETRRYPIVVPPAWAGRDLRILLASTADFVEWDQDRSPEKFVPHSLLQMIEMIERVPDEGTLTLRVYAREPGAMLQGVELSGLPPSIAAVSASLSRKGGIQELAGLLLEERQFEMPWVLTGGEQIEIQISE